MLEGDTTMGLTEDSVRCHKRSRLENTVESFPNDLDGAFERDKSNAPPMTQEAFEEL